VRTGRGASLQRAIAPREGKNVAAAANLLERAGAILRNSIVLGGAVA